MSGDGQDAAGGLSREEFLAGHGTEGGVRPREAGRVAAELQAVTGNGGADKQQVAFMVGRVLVVTPEATDHAADALASAICLIEARQPLRVFD